MKIKENTRVLVSFCAAALLGGCGEQDGGDAPGSASDAMNSASEQAETTAGDVTRETKETAETARRFAAEKIDEYRSTMDDRLADVNQRIQRFEQQLGSMGGQAKAQMQSTLDALKKQRDAFEERIGEMTASSEQAWDDVKSGVDKAWDDLSAAVDQAAERFGDQAGGGDG